MAPVRLTRATLETPLGEMLALSSPIGLCALEFAGPNPREVPAARSLRVRVSNRLGRLEDRLRRHFPPHEIVDGETATIAATRAWLRAYFAGVSAKVDPLPLDFHGASFEQQVWHALLAILPGETTSYGELARRIGHPGASRAVGAANGANPIAIVVPCHRVIGSSGALTGYGGGLDRKTWLIDHERRWRRDCLF